LARDRHPKGEIRERSLDGGFQLPASGDGKTASEVRLHAPASIAVTLDQTIEQPGAARRGSPDIGVNQILLIAGGRQAQADARALCQGHFQ
jgi:hypothetical protein